MRGEFGLQLAVVVIAGVAGWSGARRSPDAPPQATPAASKTAFNLRNGPPTSRLAHARWRRPEGPAGVDFEPVVVDFTALPTEERPEDDTRDEGWAAPQEAALTERVTSGLGELFPGVSISSACKSWSCDVDIVVPRDEAGALHGFVLRTLPLGPRVGQDLAVLDDGNVRVTFNVDLSELRDTVQWRAWIAAVDRQHQADRAAVIAAQKKGAPWPGGS